MKITPPPAALKLLALLEQAGLSAYFVGGCVRDAQLGLPPKDWDIAAAAPPERVMRACAGLRVIESGLRHGTVTVLVDGQAFEVTSFRREGNYSDRRRPDTIAFTADLFADLSRRDFTCNAMAWHPAKGLSDPFGGAADLEARTLRCVGGPALRFAEDALRILRALRFAAVLGLRLEAATAAQCFAHKGALAFVAAERKRDELLKLLCGANTAAVLLEYAEIFTAILPALTIAGQSCAALQTAPPRAHIRLALLLQTEADARASCEALRCPRRFTDAVCLLVRLQKSALAQLPPGSARGAELRRLLGRHGAAALLDWIALREAQAPPGEQPEWTALKTEIAALQADDACLSRGQLAINGKDLQALGMRGRQVGEVLERLLEQVLTGRLANDRGTLLRAAQKKK
ncbi:MAG: tRNA nucleotidyltransferase [Oscillospiraceae bacterium]|jgi:tRNA nucleotidyltransferase (CCA-adding enzyme)|nr:tRNA nucleotidyltransferase [Oscillospiraceae bacterium]